jgi:hypothetical protein
MVSLDIKAQGLRIKDESKACRFFNPENAIKNALWGNSFSIGVLGVCKQKYHYSSIFQDISLDLFSFFVFTQFALQILEEAEYTS